MCSHSSRSGLYEKQPEKDRLQRESAHIYSRVQKIFLLAIAAGYAFVVARYDYLQRSCVNTLPQDRLTSDAFGINGRAASQLNALLRALLKAWQPSLVAVLIAISSFSAAFGTYYFHTENKHRTDTSLLQIVGFGAILGFMGGQDVQGVILRVLPTCAIVALLLSSSDHYQR